MQQLQSGFDQAALSAPAVSAAGDGRESRQRVLLPVKQIGDIEAALAYLLTRDRGAVHPGYAETLLAAVDARCRADAVAHQSYIRAGDLVFSILDAAEQLACDAIWMPCANPRPWYFLFPTKTVRQVQRLRRDMPLVLIDADGIIIRSKSA